MATYSIQHALQGLSGEAKDRFINTFHVSGPTTRDATVLGGMVTAIKAFYTGLASFMSGYACGPGRTIKIYDLSDVKPRPPIWTDTETGEPFTRSSSTYLPEEVAVCLSYGANPASGQPQGRRRGRIYLGPLNVGALGTEITGKPSHPSTSLTAQLLAEGVTLNNALKALPGTFDWILLSPTSNTFVPLAYFAVDNAFDTQRRRGPDPTSRIKHDSVTGAVL